MNYSVECSSKEFKVLINKNDCKNVHSKVSLDHSQMAILNAVYMIIKEYNNNNINNFSLCSFYKLREVTYSLINGYNGIHCLPRQKFYRQ
jgi:hypothetical protein